ncbi:MAG: hypothetical protein EU547_02590 [Promethearchaeota archaeon]|nr:MAG: hypothetical protein EU547_02590 [Candidatus Lokiarchaeota archaeon]
MATTIQISETTKRKLFEIINRLEKEWGRRVTYDEAILFLIQNKVSKVNKREFLENIKKFQGILEPEEAKKLLKDLRREDHEREKRFIKKIDNS